MVVGRLSYLGNFPLKAKLLVTLAVDLTVHFQTCFPRQLTNYLVFSFLAQDRIALLCIQLGRWNWDIVAYGVLLE